MANKVYQLVLRKDMINDLVKEKIEFGLKPENAFKHYENEGLIPKAQSRGMGQGQGRQVLYPEYVFDMVKQIRELKDGGKKITDIKAVITKKYKWAFHLEDLEQLKSLTFSDQKIIDYYCETWGIHETGRKKRAVKK
jgi:phage terminase small subunit